MAVSRHRSAEGAPVAGFLLRGLVHHFLPHLPHLLACKGLPARGRHVLQAYRGARDPAGPSTLPTPPTPAHP
eukprot:366096-Chlamydomonas_euryale.AAC.5